MMINYIYIDQILFFYFDDNEVWLINIYILNMYYI